MRQIQVNLPQEYKDDTHEILEDYSSEINSSEIEHGDQEEFIQFTATVDQQDIDDITEELKDLDVESGDLSISVLDQESLIEKGVQTRGPASSTLSSQEIYSKAQQASGFNNAQWAMTALSGGIAGIGLASGNLIVLIGAILLAPVLYPLAALSTSLKMGDSTMLAKSIKTSFLSISVLLVCSLPVFYLLGESKIDVLVDGYELVALSFLVGGAAMLTFISEYREEMAGAALAVAIVPPTAFIAEALYLGDLSNFIDSVTVLAANVLSVIAAGYIVLAAKGAKPLTEYRLRDSKKMDLIIVIIGLTLVTLLYLAV